MFDEFNEGNQIAKTAENASMQPANSGRRALDADGTPCSSDYYLRITADGGRMFKRQTALTATRPTQPVVGTTPPPGTTVALRSRANNRYVSAPNSGTSPLIADATTAGAAQRFTLVDLGGGNAALRAAINGRFVCAENAGAGALIANRTAAGPWETFRLIPNGNGTVSLLCTVNSRYVCADNAGASALIANRTAIGAWEQFDQVPA